MRSEEVRCSDYVNKILIVKSYPNFQNTRVFIFFNSQNFHIVHSVLFCFMKLRHRKWPNGFYIVVKNR
jgi:hypothetical protein